MSDPSVYEDRREAADVGRKLKELEAPYRLAQRWREVMRDLEDANADPELSDLAAELGREAEGLESELKLALVETDPADRKDVIVEIRQGVGGDEAALWAGDVLRMLTRYAERRGWKTEQLGSSPNEARRLQGRHVRGQGRRRVLRLQVGRRHAPGPARSRDRVAGPHPHLDRDRRRDAGGRGGRGRDRPERAQDRRLPLHRPRRPEREHDRLRGPDHAPADRHGGRDAGREVAAPEQAEGAARAPRTALRARARAPAGGARRDAALADRLRRARGEDPHVQLPREPRDRPPDPPDAAQARPDARGRARRVHRGAHCRGPPPRAREA